MNVDGSCCVVNGIMIKRDGWSRDGEVVSAVASSTIQLIRRSKPVAAWSWGRLLRGSWLAGFL